MICLSKFLKQKHCPAKLSYSLSSKWRIYSGKLKNFPSLNPKIPVCLWLNVCTMVLLRRVTARSNHGRNDGGQGAQFPGRRTTMKAPNDCGAPRSPNNGTSTSVQYICFRKTSGSNMVTLNLLLAPGAI